MRVRGRLLQVGLGDRHAVPQAVREEAGAPGLLHEAAADDRAEVREVGVLGRVGLGHDEAAQAEAQVDPEAARGGGEEVRVDAGLGGVVVGQLRVEP